MRGHERIVYGASSVYDVFFWEVVNDESIVYDITSYSALQPSGAMSCTPMDVNRIVACDGKAYGNCKD